jgi:hypothetical protein
MNEQKSLLVKMIEVVEQHYAEQRATVPEQDTRCQQLGRLRRFLRWLTPNGGTLLLIAVLLLTQNVWARQLAAPVNAPGPSATTVNYQGRLADSGGTPLDGTYGMSFSLWDAATDGSLVWGPESHTAVPVSEGLFSAGLGSQTSGGIPTTTWNGDRYLEITVGGETLAPRELIRSVPIAGMALAVPDEAITADKLTPTAVGKWTMLDSDQEVLYYVGVDSFDWQVIDLSTFVSATSEIAYVTIWLKDTQGKGWCSVRPYGSTSNAGAVITRSTLAGLYDSAVGLIALNDSKIEWTCRVQSGATINDAGIALWGYYEPGH